MRKQSDEINGRYFFLTLPVVVRTTGGKISVIILKFGLLTCFGVYTRPLTELEGTNKKTIFFYWCLTVLIYSQLIFKRNFLSDSIIYGCSSKFGETLNIFIVLCHWWLFYTRVTHILNSIGKQQISQENVFKIKTLDPTAHI